MYKPKDITIGITTRFGTPSVIKTVESIRSCQYGSKVKIIIINGGGKYLSKDQKILDKLNAKVFNQKDQGTISQKVEKIIKFTKTSILAITQDDILMSKNIIIDITSAFNSSTKNSMIMPEAKFLDPINSFQKAIKVGREIADTVIHEWNKGDNFISMNGRFMAFQTNYIKKFRLPENIVSFDTFMYLENKRLDGNVVRINTSYIELKSPVNFKDHAKQSARYMNTKNEILSLFPELSPKYFQIPKNILIYSTIIHALSNPVYFVIYSYIKIMTIINYESYQSSPIWDIDITTKL